MMKFLGFYVALGAFLMLLLWAMKTHADDGNNSAFMGNQQKVKKNETYL